MAVILLNLVIFLQGQVEFIVNNCVNHCSSNLKITLIDSQQKRVKFLKETIKKLELKSIVTEIVLEITLIVCELLVFGRLFHWFTSLSFMLLVCMGVVIYIISLFLNLLQMKQEAIEINLLIKNRNKNQD